MGTVYSKALDKEIEVDRFIGKAGGNRPGPTVIFFGGIHGNEPAGVFALERLFKLLEPYEDKIKGSVYGIAGNLRALKRRERYDSRDLNRLWTAERMEIIENNSSEKLEKGYDTDEQLELYDIISEIVAKESGPFYFLDLHTTSSETMPFLTVNDTLLNRKFSIQFPVPIILGIEEYLDGPLLSYINYKGFIAVGFESGQHDDMASIENHLAFAYCALGITGCVAEEYLAEYKHFHSILAKSTIETRDIFEIVYRHEIQPKEIFKMEAGFLNFGKISKNQLLAKSDGQEVKADRNGRIFMPLYQSAGNDGYFIVRKIPKFLLRLSAWFRKMRADRMLAILPGVKWGSPQKDVLLIKKRIARFLAKDLMHLMGYRSRDLNQDVMIAKNRERASREDEYKNARWYSSKRNDL